MSDKQTQCKRIVAYIREKGCITSHYSIVENGVEV